MFKPHFQCGLGLNQVKYARITITHVCFIALTLAGSLGRCLNTAECSNSFLGTRQMLLHEKTCVIPKIKKLHHCIYWKLEVCTVESSVCTFESICANRSNMIFEDLDLLILSYSAYKSHYISYRYEDLGRFPHRGLHCVLMSHL